MARKKQYKKSTRQTKFKRTSKPKSRKPKPKFTQRQVSDYVTFVLASREAKE